MPAKVEAAFKRGVSALFGQPLQGKQEADAPANIFRAWNSLAVKFPAIYEFASVTTRARNIEEKLCVFFKLDPGTKEGRSKLAVMFLKHIESESATVLETALEKWWNEVSHD